MCVNHTYYVRQADCLCSTNLQGFIAISEAQYGAQLDLNSLNCLCLPKEVMTFFCLLVIRDVPSTSPHPLTLSSDCVCVDFIGNRTSQLSGYAVNHPFPSKTYIYCDVI